MKVYISGPMSGLPKDNFPAFDAVAQRLRAMGLVVLNPTELNPGVARPPDDASPEVKKAYWCKCICVDTRAVTECDAIVLLPGWQYSSGAQSELTTAFDCGKQIVMLETLIPRCEWVGIPFPPVTLFGELQYGADPVVRYSLPASMVGCGAENVEGRV